MHSEYKHCADAATLRPKWGTHLLVAPPLTPFSPVLFDLFSFLRCVRRICCSALLPRCHFWSSMKIYLNTLNAPKTHFTGKEGTLQTWNNESNKNASRSDQTERNSLLLKTHWPLQFAHLFIHCWTTGIYIQESDLKLVFGTGQWVHCTQITRPQSPDLKPAERLWDVVKQQSLVRKPTNLQKCVMLSCQYGSKSVRIVSSTLEN